MKLIDGNMIEYTKEGLFDVIVHSCNCFNTMVAIHISIWLNKDFGNKFIV